MPATHHPRSAGLAWRYLLIGSTLVPTRLCISHLCVVFWLVGCLFRGSTLLLKKKGRATGVAEEKTQPTYRRFARYHVPGGVRPAFVCHRDSVGRLPRLVSDGTRERERERKRERERERERERVQRSADSCLPRARCGSTACLSAIAPCPSPPDSFSLGNLSDQTLADLAQWCDGLEWLEQQGWRGPNAV